MVENRQQAAAGLRLGVDLGGTSVKLGLVDGQCRIVARSAFPTGAGRPWQQVAQQMADQCRLLLQQAEGPCHGVGVGCPGAVDPAAGRVAYAPNLGWEGVPLASFLGGQLQLPVQLENDANCAALAEARAGAARGFSSAVMLTLGTGVGGGVIVDGAILSAGLPGAAELGHTLLVAGGELCGCGRRGCFEAYCSATALIRQACRAARQAPDSLLWALCGGDLSRMDGQIPFLAADRGDGAACRVVEEYLRLLGEGIVNLVNIFRPQVVVLGGGIAGQGERLTAPLSRFVAQHSFAARHLPAPLVVPALLGNDAGVVGAACLLPGGDKNGRAGDTCV